MARVVSTEIMTKIALYITEPASANFDTGHSLGATVDAEGLTVHGLDGVSLDLFTSQSGPQGVVGGAENVQVRFTAPSTKTVAFPLPTGGTLIAMAETLKSRGARDIYAAVTHGVLSKGASARIGASRIKRMFITDLGGSVYTARFDGSGKRVLLFAQGNLSGIAFAEIPSKE